MIIKAIKFCLTDEQYDRLLTPTSAQVRMKQILDHLSVPDLFQKMKDVYVLGPTHLRLLLSWGLKRSDCEEIGITEENRKILLDWYEDDQSYKFSDSSMGNESKYVHIV